MNSLNNSLKINSLCKSFGAFKAVQNIDLSVESGEFLTILGASGSGKTTLLRMIAGFEQPTSGTVRIGGREIQHLPAHQRNIGMVFQSYALFPHYSVAENVSFPLQMRKLGRVETEQKVKRALSMVGLTDFADRLPKQLSGGQQQRVALARAIVFEPTILLMDEPFGALDRKLRDRLQSEVRSLQKSLNLTTIFITHDQEEALSMSDRVALMDGGQVVQIDQPEKLYFKPVNEFAASFVGESNLIRVSLSQNEHGSAEVSSNVPPSAFCLSEESASRLLSGREQVLLLVRPEALTVSQHSRAPLDALRFSGILKEKIFLGSTIRLVVDCDGIPMNARLNAAQTAQPLAVGDRIELVAEASQTTVIK